jgi:hypothetical protein
LVVIAAYRLLGLQELYALYSLPAEVLRENKSATVIVKMCGLFLTIKNDYVCIIY